MAKQALCVGINNYPGTKSDLSGCVNDARDWARELRSRGYRVKVLLDKQATRRAIVGALTKLMTDAAAGDSLVFTFSGHGSWLPDDGGEEPDGRDEMLCPHDVGDEQYLLDDDLAAIFSQKTEGARLYFISDSCHSGSVTRFAAEPLASTGRAPRIRLLPPLEFVKKKETRKRVALAARAPRTSRDEAYPALLLSGCRDVEFSYDAHFDGRPNGVMTRAALDALKHNPETPQEWFRAIRARLPSQMYPQTPQLYGGRGAKMGPMF
jgi:metacaspase-1